MIVRSIDFKQRHTCVAYLRMSTEAQNKRSPDQQMEEIQRRINQLGYPWEIVKSYRDNGVSGRYQRKRDQYQEMLREIRVGTLQVDFVLVDTLERFGRVDDLQAIRKDLHQKNGVLVLTADSNFADPTTAQGKALVAFEAMRATDDGRIKAHNVLRGKRDAARQKQWPGGPAPFGFKLHSILKDNNGCQEVAYRTLVPDSEKDWIVKLLFQKAADSGWGQLRLTQFLNQHPDIPETIKPFQSSSVGYWLGNPIYVGDLRWAKYCTDVIDDARVIELNALEDVLLITDFCQGLVTREVYHKIQAIRDARRVPRVQPSNDGKQIKPLAPGLALKYLLSGLVRCGHCRRAMIASSSTYVTVAGEEHHYVTYGCPGYLDRTCENNQRISESWLRKVVVGQIKQRLFPAP